MLTVAFEHWQDVGDALFKYAVITSRYQGKWVYCQQRNKSTWEMPGGHRELGEKILDTARRELYEETGALQFELFPVCAYIVEGDVKTYGLLCFAEIEAIGELPLLEIERIQFFSQEPELLSYPQIQPLLLRKIKDYLTGKP